MIVREALRTAVRALLGTKVRSVLTMLGVIIGVSSITSLIGIGQGLKRDVTAQIAELGANLLVVLPGQVRTEGGGFNPTASVGASTLTAGDIAALRMVPGVTDATPLSLLAGLPVAGERQAPGAFTLAVEPAFFRFVSTADLVAGRVLNDEDEVRRARVAVLDRGPQRALFPDRSPADVVGQTFVFGRETFTVVGLVESPEATSFLGSSGFATALFLPYATAREVNANTQIFRIAARTDASQDTATIADRVRAALRDRHGVDDFTVFTQKDLLAVVERVLTLLTTAVTGIGAISLLVGGIGIMNIMLVSVTERTKEIGIRKALGASSGNVLVQFLLEAVFLSVLGGLIGLGLAFVASFPVQATLGLTLLVNPLTIGLAFGFSVLVGVVFGVAPAARASRLNPVDALRYD